MPRTKAALLGVGTLGSIFGRRLLDAGVDLAVYDLDETRTATLADHGAAVAADPAHLVAGREILLVSLPDPPATRRALLGPDGALAACSPGTLVIDSSTIDPQTARQAAAAAAEHELDYLETPLSGGDEEGSGVDAARAGACTFMCGGDAATVVRATPFLRLLGRHVLHVGPAGDGATVKLVSNHLAGLHNLVAAEALAAGRAAGLSLETMLRTFRHTDAQSFWLFNYLAPRLERQEFEDGFAIDLQLKDHRLFGELAAAAGAPTPLNDLAVRMYEQMQAQGLGRRDLTEAANVACDEAGVPRYDAP